MLGSAPSWHQVSLRLHEKTIAELMQLAGRRDRTKFQNQVLKPLVEAGWLEMTIPNNRCRSKQKHWVTTKGRDLCCGHRGWISTQLCSSGQERWLAVALALPATPAGLHLFYALLGSASFTSSTIAAAVLVK